MADFYQMQAEAKELADPTVEPCELFMVVAWDRGWGQPSAIGRNFFRTEKAAKDAAAKLAPQWTHRTIVKVVLPAKEVIK